MIARSLKFVECTKFKRTLFGAIMYLSLLGCSPVPLDAPKPISMSNKPSVTSPLQVTAKQFSFGLDSEQSSFAQLTDGNEALGARLRLIEAAEHTLDLQYFLLKADLGGALIAQALLDAADRNVRVRVLLDDVFTTVGDQGLGFLNAHPNIDLRIYNPSMRPGPKFIGFVTEFGRINRRMHNKSFTADGSFSIIGGRNIADEYFQIDTTSEFADFDLLVFGPAVAKISDSFDLYWNDGWSVPMERLRKPPSQEQLKNARDLLNTKLVPAQLTYENAVNDPYFERLRNGSEPVYTGQISIVSDNPGKLKVPVPQGERIVAEDLLRRIRDAEEDVLLVTPYFVPEDYGSRLFQNASNRGVRVRIVTNSLGSTNHTYVHSGYRRHRGDLLKAGVELYEIREDALQVLGLVPKDSSTGLVMHTKLVVIDGRTVFVGSLNLDPRSIKQNSELGAFIDSSLFASRTLTALEAGLSDYTYRLAETSDGELQWYYDNPAAASVTSKEPGATVWNELLLGLVALIDVELQL